MRRVPSSKAHWAVKFHPPSPSLRWNHSLVRALPRFIGTIAEWRRGRCQSPASRHWHQDRVDLHILYWLAKKVEETVPEAEASTLSPSLGSSRGPYPRSWILSLKRGTSSDLTVTLPIGTRSTSRRSSRTSAAAPLWSWNGFVDRKLWKLLALVLIWKLWPPMCSALFKMVFEDGFFHGDLHPGNLWYWMMVASG